MVTKKNKEQFEEWLNKTDWFEDTELFSPDYTNMDFFSDLKLEMQLGVYLAYYDSKGYSIDVFFSGVYPSYGWDILRFQKENTIATELEINKFYSKSRNEAYKEAFKQADKLINNE